MEKGAAKYGVGDVQGAKELWKRSLEIKKTAELLFKLGLTHYHLSQFSCFFRVPPIYHER